MALLFLAEAVPSPPGAVFPAAYQRAGWQTVCSKGRDEYAVDCRAQLKIGSVAFKINTGDGQLYVSSEGNGCRDDVRIGWRDKLIGLRTARRLALVRQKLIRLASHCSDPLATQSQFRFIPDIASASEDLLR